MRQIRPIVCLAWILALVVGASASPAQQLPGVGYSAQDRGLSISRYILDSVLNPYTTHVMDFSARPDLVGASPNANYFDFSDPAVKAAYEQRYGVGTTTRLIRWQGPGNEVRFILREALVWAHQAHPEWLDNPGQHNGEPTELEITDAQAVNDRALYSRYLWRRHQASAPRTGFTFATCPSRRATIDTVDAFWGMPYYVYNDYQFLPVSPQIPGC